MFLKNKQHLALENVTLKKNLLFLTSKFCSIPLFFPEEEQYEVEVELTETETYEVLTQKPAKVDQDILNTCLETQVEIETPQVKLRSNLCVSFCNL